MSLEIKSIDVANEEEAGVVAAYQGFGWRLKSSQRIFHQSSTPRGAVTYKNLTYIHSETETVDFTKLVFERDTEMRNYDEIVDLEDEFWEISDSCPSVRPPEPKLMGFENWIKETKPSFHSALGNFLISAFFYLLSGILFGLLVYFLGGVTGDVPRGPLSFVLSIFISLLIVPIHVGVSIVLSRAYNFCCLKFTDPHGNKHLQLAYSKYVEKTNALREEAYAYDEKVSAMRRLLRDSKRLF